MTKAQMKKWVKALRSGRYKQGIGSLENDNSYCCLGVARAEKLCKAKRGWPEGFVSESFLPHSIQEDLALKNDGLNCQRSYSFNEIADYIEKHYLEWRNK